MKLLMLVPLFAVLSACATSNPTTQTQRDTNAKAERIADHMASRMDRR